MPLHLLGKKSWNVYNKDNVARVRRDEARAKAEEEEKERKQREEDAERRVDILRGKISTPLGEDGDEKSHRSRTREKLHGEVRHRKRRRLAGENDTDRDIRFAKEDAELTHQRAEMEASRRPVNDAPIVDKSGHISLFPEEPTSRRRRSDKNPEAEAETARKNQEFEDQYTMRFSNAAGYKQQLASAPWYSSSTAEISAQSTGLPTTNVWGDEDPRRQEREKIRIATNDPLAAMKKGVKQLREVEKERTKWAEEKERELRALKKEEKEKRWRRRHQENGNSDDSFDGFRLDASVEKRERRHHRSRSRDLDRDRDSRRDRSRRGEEYRKRHSDTHESKPRPEKTSVAWSQAPGKRYSAQFSDT
ncbi:homocitrate synthase [Nannizzia gypsea CBS 118893]|uniref:Homocitrate synthase n=1 Tax=Arthroderma gypseum (strain ATCC MYA-4604 / CBS 118893) TaxID=535722 RepID=E5R2I3_ARTGP|nr:homocitrate synthase [Nannizzia gypsea CBS 118893]EFQ97859.1 homocitrate synthase [Nannizzia gypsea CBS 118893]